MPPPSAPCYELWYPSLGEPVDTGDCIPHFETAADAAADAAKLYTHSGLETPVPRQRDHPCVTVECSKCGSEFDADGEYTHFDNTENAAADATFSGWRITTEGWLCVGCGLRLDHNIPDFTHDFVAGVVPPELDAQDWDVNLPARRAIFTVRTGGVRMAVSVEELAALSATTVGRYEICVADYPYDKSRRSLLARTNYPYAPLADLGAELVRLVELAREKLDGALLGGVPSA